MVVVEVTGYEVRLMLMDVVVNVLLFHTVECVVVVFVVVTDLLFVIV